MTTARPTISLTMSVVICVYTLDRWDDILAAVESVRTQSMAPTEIIVVVDHNPELLVRLRAALAGVTVVETARVAACPVVKTPASRSPRDKSWHFWTMTRWPMLNG